MLSSIILLTTGLFLLVKGADILISSSIAIGKKLKVSEFFIGLIVVGFGTSLCELLVSIDAVIKNSPDISVGNVIGSNIANILLVTFAAGMTKELKSIKVSSFDLSFHLGSHFFFLLIFLFSFLDRDFGFFFLILFFLYLFKSFRNSESETIEETNVETDFFSNLAYNKPLKLGLPISIIAISITLLGADITVDSAINISSILDISDSFIGLTIIALGTSLPEIATSITAAKRGKSNIIVGNILGSNIYNLLLILGFTSLFENFSYDKKILSNDVIFLFLSSFFFTMLIYKKKIIGRSISIFCIIIYFLYLLYLYLNNF